MFLTGEQALFALEYQAKLSLLWERQCKMQVLGSSSNTKGECVSLNFLYSVPISLLSHAAILIFYKYLVPLRSEVEGPVETCG